MSSFASLKELEQHLSVRSYIQGFEPSQADVGVFTVVKSAPDAKTYPHVARWYKHIATWESEHANLKGDASAAPLLTLSEAEEPKAAQASAASAPVAEDDDDVDLFGSDDDDEEANAEAERVKNERIAAYKAKKDEKAAANAAAGKDAPVAKSVVTMQVKPWDDETDMAELEKCVRSIEKDGLVWGLSKLVPVGYGVRMLQINLVIEDEKIGLDDLQEEIAEFEDFVQSSDIAAMQKL